MGKLAWAKACEMLEDPDLRADLRFQVAKFVYEAAYGKPQQALDVTADVESDAKVSMVETMSLSKRGEAMKKAIDAYEKGSDK